MLLPPIIIRLCNAHPRRSKPKVAKRSFDIALASIALVLLSPVILCLALLIKLDSPGPVIYRGRRAGRLGGSFLLLKFRTMIVGADKGPSSTPDDDARITKMGRFLRQYKLDELPQLFNILFGEMSFVGPRPQVEWVVKGYSEEERELLKLRPGLTDYSSLKFANEGEILRGSADPDGDYFKLIHPEKMRLSLAYMREQSFSVDCKIILKTALAAAGFRSNQATPANAKLADQPIPE